MTALASQIQRISDALIAHGDTAHAMQLYAIAHDVRRIERALDEIVADAAQDAYLTARAARLPQGRKFGPAVMRVIEGGGR